MSQLIPRDDSEGSRNIVFAVVLGVLGFFLVATTIFLFIRKRRQVIQQPDKDDVPGFWGKISRYFKPRGNYVAAAGEDGNNQSHQLDSAPSRRNRDVEQANPTASAAVNRNTSVRSVLTLPAYSHSASHNERVLGREGDRDGMDVVVDLPTMEDEEELREQEMGALYQLRLARRQQNEEREEVRRQRREAQRRGDTRELAEIRSRDRAASNSHNSLVEDLRRDIERAKENRQRSVSSVSYADLGVARHDGTRIRANSQESERMGLLSDAADIAALSIRSGANSPALHGRHRSGSSVGSFDSDFPSPGLTRTRPDSQAATSSGLSVGRGRAGSSPEIVESDLGVEPIPPPDYEDVPLDDDNDVRGRSTTPINEPPPGYSGPVRRLSERDPDTTTERLAPGAVPPESTSEDGASTPRGRGVGGTPQLPSLRISRLPEIVIEPSSARPRETTDQ